MRDILNCTSEARHGLCATAPLFESCTILRISVKSGKSDEKLLPSPSTLSNVTQFSIIFVYSAVVQILAINSLHHWPPCTHRARLCWPYQPMTPWRDNGHKRPVLIYFIPFLLYYCSIILLYYIEGAHSPLKDVYYLYSIRQDMVGML